VQRQFTSLRSRLTRRLALALAGIGVIGTIAAYSLASSYANLAYDQALTDDVLTMAKQVSMEQDRVQVALPDAALKWLLADEGELVLYRVTDLRDMQVLAARGDLGPIPASFAANGQAAYRDVKTGGRRMRVSYVRSLVDPNDVPVLIEIGETTGKRDRLTRGILAVTILFMATMIGVAVGLVRHGVRTALAPLNLLEEEVAQRSGTELTPLDPLHAPDEVRGLIDAINRLMARVSSVLESQSHFISNAAHQLRTPLAGLYLQAQRAKKASNRETLDTCLADVEASAARADHLIEQILVLAKADAVDPMAEGQPVNLDAVARQVIERFLPLADQRRMDLGYDGGAKEIYVAGNDTLFVEMIGNLVDNALRYGRDGGRATIETRLDGNDALVSVIDDGPGLANGDQEQIFARFYRSDSSARGGAGLGLAIVREIVERYRGRITVNSKLGEGCRFDLRFPSAAQQVPPYDVAPR
jgi:two-component system sensor histidine kinase TctE